VIVARTPNQAKRVTGFAERLKLNIAVIHGCQDLEGETEEADGRNSPPPPLSSSGADNSATSMSKRRSVFTIPSLALGSSNYHLFFRMTNSFYQSNSRKKPCDSQ
jgi:hypothetical protein